MGINIDRVPRSFGELRDEAAESAAAVARCGSTYREVADPLTTAMQATLRLRLRPEEADVVVDAFHRQIARVVDAASQLRAELNALSNMAEQHRHSLRRTPGDSRREDATSVFKI